MSVYYIDGVEVLSIALNEASLTPNKWSDPYDPLQV